MSYFAKLALTFLVSMVPVIELRGAIPIGVGYGLNFWVAIVVSLIGNLVPVPFIIIFIKKIFALLRRWSPKLDRVVTALENRAEKKSDVVQRYAFWGLFILVAIPLPGTGAWTGALVANFLDLPIKKTLPIITVGVLTAGVIITTLAYTAPDVFRMIVG